MWASVHFQAIVCALWFYMNDPWAAALAELHALSDDGDADAPEAGAIVPVSGRAAEEVSLAIAPVSERAVEEVLSLH